MGYEGYRRSKQPIFDNFDDNIEYFKKQLGVGESFDSIHLDLHYAGRDMGMFLIDGFAKDDIIHYLMKLLADLEPEQLGTEPLMNLVRTYLPYMEVNTEDDLNKSVFWVLSGGSALVVDGIDKIIIIDARTYPARSPSEPDLERVSRGARDGFVETSVFNTALTRRRVRDPSLRMEYMSIGRRSQTDIVVSYIKDIADPSTVKQIKSSLKNIDTDGLPMGEKTLEEFLCGRSWNPYPTVRYTERPDTAAIHLYEGHVLVIVDGSPSVMITPATFWHHVEHAEEYRQRPVTGAYFRMVRFFAIFMSIFLTPLWLLFVENQHLLPAWLSFLGPKESIVIPLLVQLLIAELGMDMLRMATIHTPTSMGTALGLVSAIIIGEMAVQVGFFTREVIIYVAIVAIGTYATPSYEFALANRLYRLVLLLATAAFGLIGFVAGITLWILALARLKSFNVPYLWPLIPFSYRSMRGILVRAPLPLKNRRPTALHPQDPDR
ncbi:spore germination protein [Virgibacillus sp. NKC19-16]|uniref:spore germination protein n=1 Tax=Virgibacillus salidurans TaxID=2831673 RepID=UPI001F1DC6C9|nr:spore germination protein [Virgibacillus sp. NKC19-16]UJL46852.1 spore germination protein [Virgibacillus sp. NKC19-16]